MLDARLRPLIDPPLERSARQLVALGAQANAITLIGFLLGLLGCLAVALGHYWLGLVLLAGNRLADGLDGAVARIRGMTVFGGYLDIVCDFIVYNALAMAFALADPQAMLPALFLLLSFAGTGTTFLAYAILAAKRGDPNPRQGRKSFYYLGGLAEGTETILFFAVCLLFPTIFPILAWVFAGLCAITTLGRVLTAWRVFGRA
ncbi:MAG: CDP-alcohol phosphatidyltransferase family protein [Rhodospirillales bacterium]|nr:CDP-alcohol phosphatidyltransferase family protein [Rhodospirillales bacterium]